MIRVFSPSDTVFTSNGNKTLLPVSCIETKVANDDWYIEVELGVEYADYIAQDSIVVVGTKYGEQPFRVGDVLIGKTIEFMAHHIGYDSENFVIDTLTHTGDGSSVLTALLGSTDTNSFTAYSNITDVKTLTFTQCSLYEALVLVQETYGGFIDFDGWQIRLVGTLGADRGVVVEYGKNLEGATVSEDWSEVCTKIYPIGNNGKVLTPKTITYGTLYDKPYTKVVQFSTDSLTELATLANAYLVDHHLPKANYKVYSTLQDVYLNDVIQVNARQYTLLANVLAYTYNSLTMLNLSVEFGNYRRTVRKAFSAINDTMKAIDQKVVANTDQLTAQTELINSAGTYGYKTVTENEIYFHDTIPLSSATNILRMNVAGIGFSTTGLSGTFSTAWTIDGKFSADFIKSGTITGREINNGTGTFQVTDAGVLTATSGTIGGWTLDTLSMYAATAGMTIEGTLTSSVRFWSGAAYASRSTAPFRVTRNGSMYSTLGSIAGWTIGTTTLTSKDGTMKLDNDNNRIYLNTSAYLQNASYSSTTIETSGNFNPQGTTGIYGLGSATYYWGRSYIQELLPTTNGTGSLGLTGTRYGNAYIDAISLKFSGTNYTITRDVNGFLKAV